MLWESQMKIQISVFFCSLLYSKVQSKINTHKYLVGFLFFREHMEKIIDQLKIKLQDTQHNLQISATELQALQNEHDTLLERHNKILQETVVKEAELREK